MKSRSFTLCKENSGRNISELCAFLLASGMIILHARTGKGKHVSSYVHQRPLRQEKTTGLRLCFTSLHQSKTECDPASCSIVLNIIVRDIELLELNIIIDGLIQCSTLAASSVKPNTNNSISLFR
jgi:hypothetical protein